MTSIVNSFINSTPTNLWVRALHGEVKADVAFYSWLLIG